MNGTVKSRLRRFFATSKGAKFLALAAVAITLGVGYAVLRTSAVSYFAGVSVGQGTLSGNAQLVGDSGAGDGVAVKFGPESSVPQPDPEPDPDPDPGPPSGGNLGSCAPYPAFPNASCTGVPAGVSLTPMGATTITQDNTVIDAKRITGTVVIRASNVVIKRSQMIASPAGRGVLKVESGSVTVEDTEMDGRGTQGGVNPGSEAAVSGSNFTLRRVNMHSFYEGPRLSNNILIENSYVHHFMRCVNSNGSNCHIDMAQSTGGSNISFIHNTIHAYNPVTDDLLNAAIIVKADFAPISNVLIEKNFLNGGNNTIYVSGCANCGGSDNPPHPISNVTIRDNYFGRERRYGYLSTKGISPVLQNNVWADTKQPIN